MSICHVLSKYLSFLTGICRTRLPVRKETGFYGSLIPSVTSGMILLSRNCMTVRLPT